MKKIALAAIATLAFTAATQAELIYGVTTSASNSAASLVSFDSATPHLVTTIGPITGASDIRAIDFRPADGKLYGVGYTGTTAGGNARVYTIDLATGAATPVGPAFALNNSSSTRVSIDFNPTVDRIRVVGGNGVNARVHPDTGALVGVDTALSSTLLVAGIAYTNNLPSATSTTLYAYEFVGDTIGIIGNPSPNDGTYNIVGSTTPRSAFNAGVGMDISSATGIAYLTMDDSPSSTAQTELYTVNLATGALSIVDTPNVDDETGIALLDLSVFPVIPEPTSLSALALGSLLLKRRRA